jgi:hypothetical protein
MSDIPLHPTAVTVHDGFTGDRTDAPSMPDLAPGEQKLLIQSLILPLVPQAVIAARTAAQADRDLVALVNAQFAAQRAEHVAGREVKLAQLVGSFAADTPLPLVVTGPPGSGNPTLLAEVAKRLASRVPAATVLTRYIGVTPGSSSLECWLLHPALRLVAHRD